MTSGASREAYDDSPADALRLPALPPIEPSAQAARRAYLELLKLALCDLIGAGTATVDGLTRGELQARVLEGDELGLRAAGRDWPRHGLTMTGLARLSDLQACVESVVREDLAGDLIETGVWRGGSSILMRATLDSLGDRSRTVWVADSFQGFPAGAGGVVGAVETTAPYLAAFDFLSVALSEVRENFERLGYSRGTRFVPGFFADTLPGLAGRRWSLVRLDGDTYEATMLGLRSLYPGLSRGGYLIVDDYGALEECRAAVEEFRRAEGISAAIEQVDWTCVRWRREDEPAEPAGGWVEGGETLLEDAASPPAPVRAARESIPSERERHLADELALAEDRHAELEVALRQRVTELENRLSEVSTSTSWRWTRPLRELSARGRAWLGGRG